MGCGCHRTLPDEAEASVDRDVGFVAEHRQRNLGQWRAVRPIPDLVADLERPLRVRVFLLRLVGLVRPNLTRCKDRRANRLRPMGPDRQARRQLPAPRMRQLLQLMRI